MATVPSQSSGTAGLPPLDRGATRTRTSDRVYDALVSAIRHLRLPPGCALSENDLAAQLNVSRTPLREAIARLVEGGLVQVVPQVGTRVSLISLREVEEARFVRESLEVAAFEAACLNDHRDVAALRELLAVQDAAASNEDFEAFFTADEALHGQVFAAAGYPGAWQAVQRMKVHLDRLRHLNQADVATIRALVADHTAIVDALAAGQLIAGREVIRAHARRASDRAPALLAEHPHFFGP